MIYDKASEYGKKYNNLSKIENFRDLGGYLVDGDRVVSSGKLFRSGALCDLADDEKAAFDALQVKHIFDFRNQNEIDEAEDYVPSFATYYKIPVINSPEMSAVSRSDIKEILKKQMTAEDFQFGENMFLQMYSLFPFNEAYRALFQAMDTGENILFHCSAGKDRTGGAAALILLALGADDETVKYDYLVTNVFRENANKEIKAKFAPYLVDERVSKLFDMGLCVSPTYLATAFKAILNKYETFDEFFEKEYCVTKERRELWKKAYTEKVIK